jgi:hypothetical protein
MAKLAWAAFFIIAAAIAVISFSVFGDRAERLAIAALIVSLYSMAVGFAQAHYARRQAESADIQARIAQSASVREELAERNLAEPALKWQIPTGSRDKINIHVQNTGGLIQITHAEVASSGTDLPLMIPVNKVAAGETFSFTFQPPASEEIFPIKITVQFQDAFGKWHETAAECGGWGKPLVEIYRR